MSAVIIIGKCIATWIFRSLQMKSSSKQTLQSADSLYNPDMKSGESTHDLSETSKAERRSIDFARRAADARAQKAYDTAHRRVLALEKALRLVLGAMVPGDCSIDPRKIDEFRQGIAVGRALLGKSPGE